MFYEYYINVYTYFLNYCKGFNVDEKQQVDTWLPRSFSLVLQVHLPPPGALNYPHAYSLCVQTKGTVEADECLSICCC